MIYKFDTFSPWHGKHEYRQCMADLASDGWVSPQDAEEILISHGAATPIANHRKFLVWKAEMGSLATIAGEVHETSGAEVALYVNVPLTTEWALDEWKSDYASLWLNGTMRMTRSYCGEKQARDFLDIMFEREEVGILAQMYASIEPTEVQVDGGGRWTEDQMNTAIRGCKHTDREDAWKRHFKPLQHLHGWKAVSFREQWSIGRGTKGRVGAPPRTRG